MSLLGSKSERMVIGLSQGSFVCSAADVDGAVVAVFWVEAEKLQACLAGSDSGVQKNRRHVKLALELAFDGADAHKRMQRLKVRYQQQRVLLAFERLQGILQPLQQAVIRRQNVCQRLVGTRPIQR